MTSIVTSTVGCVGSSSLSGPTGWNPWVTPLPCVTAPGPTYVRSHWYRDGPLSGSGLPKPAQTPSSSVREDSKPHSEALKVGHKGSLAPQQPPVGSGRWKVKAPPAPMRISVVSPGPSQGPPSTASTGPSRRPFPPGKRKPRRVGANWHPKTRPLAGAAPEPNPARAVDSKESVERALTSDANGTEPNKGRASGWPDRSFYTHNALVTPAQAEFFTEHILPGVNLVKERGASNPNAHCILAVARMLCLEFVVTQIPVDAEAVAGICVGPKRIKHAIARVKADRHPWVAFCPRVTVNDITRYYNVKFPRWMRDVPQHFHDCPDELVQTSVMVFEHSSYYYQPHDIGSALQKVRLGWAFAVMHDVMLMEGRGTACNGELAWEVRDDEVTISTAGGSSYSHSRCSWMKAASFPLTPECSMFWKRIYSVPAAMMSVYLFFLGAPTIRTSATPVEMVDPEAQQMVKFELKQPRWTFLPSALWGKTTRVVEFPAALADAADRYAAQRACTSNTVSSAISTLSTKFPTLSADQLAASVCRAFGETSPGSALVYTMKDYSNTSVPILNNLRKSIGEPIESRARVWSRRAATSAIALGVAGLTAQAVNRILPIMAGSPTTRAVARAVTTAVCHAFPGNQLMRAGTVGAVISGLTTLATLSWLLPGGYSAQLSLSDYDRMVVGTYATPPLFRAVHPIRDLLPMAHDCSCFIDKGPRDQHACQPDAPRIAMIGYAFPDVMAVVSCNCSHNTEIAIRNRFTAENSEDEPSVKSAWHSFPSQVDASPLLGRAIGFAADVFREDVGSWFTRAKAAVRRAVGEILAKEEYPQERFTRKGFVKIEKLAKYVRGKLVDYDPRLINGFYPFHNFELGPFVEGVYSALKRAFRADQDPPRVCMSTGMDVLAVGEWFHHWWDDGLCTALCVDKTRLDLHITTAALRAEFAIYRKVHEPPTGAMYQLKKQLYTKGQTTSGWTYCAPGRRKSGDPNTTCGNTILCMFSAVLTLEALAVPESDYALIGTGDDMVMLVRDCNPAALSANFSRHQRENYGFINKITIARHPWDICYVASFPLVGETDGKEVWSLTPTIGRCLAKLGYTVHVELMRRWRQLALETGHGVSTIAPHNPIFAAYADRLKHYLGPVGATIAPDPEAQYKHQAANVTIHGTFETIEWLHRRYPDHFDRVLSALQNAPPPPAILDVGVADLTEADW